MVIILRFRWEIMVQWEAVNWVYPITRALDMICKIVVWKPNYRSRERNAAHIYRGSSYVITFYLSNIGARWMINLDIWKRKLKLEKARQFVWDLDLEMSVRLSLEWKMWMLPPPLDVDLDDLPINSLHL